MKINSVITQKDGIGDIVSPFEKFLYDGQCYLKYFKALAQAIFFFF